MCETLAVKNPRFWTRFVFDRNAEFRGVSAKLRWFKAFKVASKPLEMQLISSLMFCLLRTSGLCIRLRKHFSECLQAPSSKRLVAVKVQPTSYNFVQRDVPLPGLLQLHSRLVFKTESWRTCSRTLGSSSTRRRRLRPFYGGRTKLERRLLYPLTELQC